MPKPKLKDTDLTCIGGRIRQARIDASLTIKELSEKIDVSYTYMGMLERGERKPPSKILECIAEATNTPIDWLSNNSKSEKAEKADPLKAPLNIDPALFLGLVMREKPPMSAETIAAVLNVDQDTLKNILDGTDNFDPAWEAAFTSFAERLEIPEILNKLRSLESFLESVDTKKFERTLIKAIQSSLSKKFGGEFTYSGQSSDQENCTDIRESRRYTGLPVKHFFFMQNSTATQWDVALHSELRESQLKSVLFTTTTYAQANCDSIECVLAFVDEKNFREALSYSNKRREEDENYVPKVVAMYLDLDSGNVVNSEVI